MRNEVEPPQRLTQTPYSSDAWARNEAGAFHYKTQVMRHEAGVVRDKAANLRHEVDSREHDIFFPNVMFFACRVEVADARVDAESLYLDVECGGGGSENQRNLDFTSYFIDDELRRRFDCCFMFTASRGKIVLRFGKFACITDRTWAISAINARWANRQRPYCK